MTFTDYAVQTDGWYTRPKYIRRGAGTGLEDSEDMRDAISAMQQRRRAEKRRDYKALLTQYKTRLAQKEMEMAAMRDEMDRLDEMVRQCEENNYR